jgi:hypothetical protein
MVAAGITLCLDILHRAENESEFVEHRQLIEKAIHLLRKYDDSTLALRGIRLLSSLLTEATTKQKASKCHAHCNKTNRYRSSEDDPPTWPESRHRIEALLAVNESNASPDIPLSTASTAVSERADNHTHIVSGGSYFPDASIIDTALRSANDFDDLNAFGGFSNANDNGLLSDMSWTDLFSNYFPAESGFDNAFLIEDLFS